MTNDGLNSLTYDAENRPVTSSGSTYTYDGNNLRVKKVSGSTTTVYIFSGSKVVAEYSNGSLSKEYIYSGSALLATIAGTTTTYHHADHLSVRASTDSSGNLVGQQGHYPYGESWYSVNTTTKWQFTSYERDAESGNDYAMMRYHVNRLGRFSSPDLIPGSAADPQSLNRYAYVVNDPVNWADPLGLRMDECGLGGWMCGGGGGGFTDASLWGSLSFWDLFALWGQGNLDFGFGANGNITFHPDDWGSARYSGSEQFAPDPATLFWYDNPSLSAAAERAGVSFAFEDLLQLTPSRVPQAPVEPCAVTQGFSRGHRAIDIRTPQGYGTRIPAPESGRVIGARSTGWRVPPPYDFSVPAPSGSTNFVSVATASRYTVTYWHTSPLVPVGTQVSQGQIIGATDNTGRQTGPHVHVTVRNPGGRLIDPRQYFQQCK